MEVITCHKNADFDCISSMVGISKIFTNAILVFPGSQERPVRDFLKTFPMDIARIKDIELSKVTKLIIVDTKSLDRIGQFNEIVDNRDVQVFVYDHHPRGLNDVRATVEFVDEVGACATLITEIIKERNINITPFEATAMCLGIYEETGSMKFPTTTERDLLAASFLLRRGADLNIVSSFLQPELSKEGLLLLNDLVASLTEVFVHGVRVKIGTAYRDSYSGEVAHFAHSIMDMEDIDGLVLILNIGGKVFIVGRSRTSLLNIAELMRRFNGGGHSQAASASLKEIPLELVKESITKALYEIVKPTQEAKDIMTAPVITIQNNSVVREAEKLLTKYEINVLPVVKDDEYVGLISREIIEKAIFHGFNNNKVIEFTTTDALTASIDMPVRTIEKEMIENNQRFVAVIDNKKPIGAITRTDLLRSLYEDYIRKSRFDSVRSEVRVSSKKNIAAILKERLPNHVYSILTKAGNVADKQSVQAYLVGGSVRDILRGQHSLDIDIVVEGDGIKYAKELSSLLNAKMKSHTRFQTAKIMGIPVDKTENCMSIDVATARTEYYEKPAELPRVETSSIKKDLYRRDFTINALAAKLNTRDFGSLIDFFGGQRDLKESTIRILHNLSFIEDPTRAFRAVRFCERFSFKISKHTENLLKTAIKLNLFDKLSGSRLFDELTRVFYEREPEKTLKSLDHYGLFRVIWPKLVYTQKLEILFINIRDTLSWYNLLFLPKKVKKLELYLMVLLFFLHNSDKEGALNRLCVPLNVKYYILKNTEDARYAAHELDKQKDDPAFVYQRLHGMKIESLLLLMSISKEEDKKKAISRYLIEHENTRSLITGKELLVMGIQPGPVYSQILEDILCERIRGNIKTKTDEINYIKENYSGFLLT